MRTIAALLLVFGAFPAAAGARSARKYHVPCETVFVTGTQTHEIAWALRGEGLKNNLYRNTCLEPVARPEDAQAILDIEIDPKVAGALDARIASREQALDDGTYSEICSSGVNGGECTDSDGNIFVDNCNASGCASYYGPNPLVEASNLLVAALANWAGRSIARGYLWDAKTHALQWQYTGAGPWHMDIAFYSDCAHKRLSGGSACKAPKKLLAARGAD